MALPWNASGNASDVIFDVSSMNMSDFLSFKQPLDIPYIRWIYISLFGIIFLCCVLGNTTVIYVILRHKKMRNITNFFLANLAFSDLCVGIFCVLPNLTTFLSPYWMLGRVLCKLYYFIQCTSYTASVLILTVISLERYFAIIHPMLNKRVTRMCLLRVVVVVIWLCAALYGIPNLIAYDLYRVNGQNNSTLNFCVTTGRWNIDMEVYSIINFIVLYLLPLLLIVIMYVRIGNALWRSGRNMGLTATSGLPSQQAAEENTCLRCPQCKQTVYRKGADGKRGAYYTDSAQADQQAKGAGAKLRRPWSPFRHATTVSQWARSVDDVSDDDSLLPRQCHCSASNNFVRSKPVVVSLAGSTRRPKRPSNPLASRRKVIRLLICIILSFAVCVLPHHLRLLWQYWAAPADNFSFVHLLIPPTTFLFFYANSALNPFLYAFLSEHFQRAFTDLLPACCGCRSRGPRRHAGSRDHGRPAGSCSNLHMRGATSYAGCKLNAGPYSTTVSTTVTEYIQ